jgi:1-acyl-sn-glycerol-3-phosphate acyltransferase
MSFLKNILGRVFAAWAIIVFITTMLIVIIPIWITGYIREPRGTEIFRRISKAWMSVFLFFIGCPLRVKGKEHFKKGENYIVVCNHNSMMDVPITTPFIPGANKTIAKIEMAKIPLFGIIYKRGSVLVDRKSEESRKTSFIKMKEVLQMGLHMCIYPEGTRNKTKEPLQRFHNGAFRLAVDTGKSILPSVIFYTGIVLPHDKKFYLWPHRIEMHFLAAIPVDNLTAEQLKDEAFKRMRDYYVRSIETIGFT